MFLTLGCIVTCVDYLLNRMSIKSCGGGKNFDALIKSIDYLKKTQAGDQKDLWKRLDQLKEVVVIGQEGAIQLVIKKLKENQTFTFKKENEKQFIFNDNVKD